MTGYSSARSDEAEFSLTVSLKSTNHRFLDLQIRMPSSLEPLEPAVRRRLKDRLFRGHIEVTVSFERTGAQALQLNRRLLDGYVAACDGLRAEFGALAPPDPVALLRIPGIITGTDGDLPGETMERVRGALEGLVDRGLAQLDEMRAAEGESLERDVLSRLSRTSELTEAVARLAGSVPELYRRRLTDRLRELVNGEPGTQVVEPARLAQEVVYLAARSDIAEELTRLRSHLGQAAGLIAEGVEVGKKLDFLLQEMNREANTILSKTTDIPEAGPEIARHAIEMKSEIEKLREQAQNIE